MRRRSFLKVLPAAALPLRAESKSPAEVIEDAIARQEIPGVIVAARRRGKTIFEMAAGYADLAAGRKMRLDDICMMASSSKPFAATAIMAAVEQRKLSPDDRISKYFPEFAGASTVRQCLCHTSGIFGNDGPPEAVKWIRNFDISLKEAAAGIVRQPLAYEPGARWVYGGASFCVVGRIVEMQTDMEFDAWARRVLFAPLELADTMYRTGRDIQGRVPTIYRRTEKGFQAMRGVMELPGRRGPRPDGFVLVPGGIYSTVQDTLRFLEMHLAEGSLDGRRILSRAGVLEMRRKQTGNLKNNYGLGWMLEDEGQRFGHGGAYGTEIWVDLRREMVAAVFTQMPLAQSRPFIKQVRSALEERIDRT